MLQTRERIEARSDAFLVMVYPLEMVFEGFAQRDLTVTRSDDKAA